MSADTAIDPPRAAAPGRPGRLGVAVILAASMMTIMAGATISPALPAMREAFADTPNAGFLVRLVITVTSASIAATAILAGLVADRIGRVRLMTGSVALYVVAGSAGLWVDGLTALLVSRAVLGIAVAGVMTSATALIGSYFDGAERSRMLGFQASAMGFGGVAFLSAGGLLAESGWRGPFLVYLAPLLILPLVPLVLPPPAPDAPHTGDGPAPREPLAPRLAIYLGAVLTMAAFYAVPVQIPFLLVERGLPDPSAGGLAIAAVTLLSALTSMQQGRILRAIPLERLAPLGAGALAAGLAGVFLAPGVALTMPALALVGIGMGVLMPSLSGLLMTITPRPRLGRVMGGFTTSVFLGQFLSPILLQPAIAAGGTAWGFPVAAALAVALAAVLRVTGRRWPAAA